MLCLFNVPRTDDDSGEIKLTKKNEWTLYSTRTDTRKKHFRLRAVLNKYIYYFFLTLNYLEFHVKKWHIRLQCFPILFHSFFFRFFRHNFNVLSAEKTVGKKKKKAHTIQVTLTPAGREYIHIVRLQSSTLYLRRRWRAKCIRGTHVIMGISWNEVRLYYLLCSARFYEALHY